MIALPFKYPSAHPLLITGAHGTVQHSKKSHVCMSPMKQRSHFSVKSPVPEIAAQVNVGEYSIRVSNSDRKTRHKHYLWVDKLFVVGKRQLIKIQML